MLTVSPVNPDDVAPGFTPRYFGTHGGLCAVSASCNSPPGAHLPLSPEVGRPSASVACWVEAAAPRAAPPASVDCVTAAFLLPPPAPDPVPLAPVPVLAGALAAAFVGPPGVAMS